MADEKPMEEGSFSVLVTDDIIDLAPYSCQVKPLNKGQKYKITGV